MSQGTRWAHKPPLGTPLDREHPLADGLAFCAPLSEGTGTQAAELITGIPLLLHNGATWSPGGSKGTYGGGLVCTAEAAGACLDVTSLPASLQLQPPLSIAVGVRYSGVSQSASQRYPLIGITPPATFGWDVNFLGYGNNGALGTHLNSSAVWQLSANTDSIVGYTVTAVGSTATETAYLNGVRDNTTYGTYTASFTPVSYGSPSTVSLGVPPASINSAFASYYCGATIYWAMIWSRALSAAEHQAIAANPWQVFAPPRMKSIFVQGLVDGIHATPSAIYANGTTQAVALAGTGTSWSGSTAFTVSGVSGCSISSKSVASTTSATLNIATGTTTGTLTISDGTYSTAVPVEAMSIAATPATIPAGHPGHITLTLTGGGTDWVSGTTTFTVSGVSGVAKVSQSITSTTSGTLVLTTGSGTGTLTISATGGATCTVAVATATLSISPATATAGESTAITLIGTNTVWTQETASSLFTLTSGPADAAISGIAVTGDTTATATLFTGYVPTGNPSGTDTIEDASTGASATVTAEVQTPTFNVSAWTSKSGKLTFFGATGTTATNGVYPHLPITAAAGAPTLYWKGSPVQTGPLTWMQTTGETPFAAVLNQFGGVGQVYLEAGGSGYVNPSTISVTASSPPAGGTAPTFGTPVTGTGITGFEVLFAGSGLSTGVQVTFTDPEGTGSGASAVALAISTTLSGAILGVKVVSGGSGYSSQTTVSFSQSGGSGATGTVQVSGGVITGVTVTNGGTGYNSIASNIFVGQPSNNAGIAPLFYALPTAAGSIGAVVCRLPGPAGYGSEYVIGQQVTVSLRTASATAPSAVLHATISGGKITAISCTNAGGDWSNGGYSLPVLYIADPTGTGATATLSVNGGTINAVTVTNQGSGYTNPTFTICDNGIADVVLLATVGDYVQAIPVESPGSGYLAPPTITISDTSGGSGASAVAVMTGPSAGDALSYTAPGGWLSTASGGCAYAYEATVSNFVGQIEGAAGGIIGLAQTPTMLVGGNHGSAPVNNGGVTFSAKNRFLDHWPQWYGSEIVMDADWNLVSWKPGTTAQATLCNIGFHNEIDTYGFPTAIGPTTRNWTIVYDDPYYSGTSGYTGPCTVSLTCGFPGVATLGTPTQTRAGTTVTVVQPISLAANFPVYNPEMFINFNSACGLPMQNVGVYAPTSPTIDRNPLAVDDNVVASLTATNGRHPACIRFMDATGGYGGPTNYIDASDLVRASTSQAWGRNQLSVVPGTEVSGVPAVGGTVTFQTARFLNTNPALGPSSGGGNGTYGWVSQKVYGTQAWAASGSDTFGDYLQLSATDYGAFQEWPGGSQDAVMLELVSTTPHGLKSGWACSLTPGSDPTVTISGGGGSGATGAAVVGAGGGVIGIRLGNAGSGYTSAPTVAITQSGASGATATATVSGGVVTGFTVTAAGSGYSNATLPCTPDGYGSSGTIWYNPGSEAPRLWVTGEYTIAVRLPNMTGTTGGAFQTIQEYSGSWEYAVNYTVEVLVPTGGTSIPFEYAASFVSQLPGCAYWVNIPEAYSDALVTTIAQICAQYLGATNPVYIEYSNECWNYGAGIPYIIQQQQNLINSLPAGTSVYGAYPPIYDSGDGLPHAMTGVLAAHACAVFEAAWVAAGRSASQITLVAGSQWSNSSVTTAVLAAIQKYGYTPPNLVVAVAPYQDVPTEASLLSAWAAVGGMGGVWPGAGWPVDAINDFTRHWVAYDQSNWSDWLANYQAAEAYQQPMNGASVTVATSGSPATSLAAGSYYLYYTYVDSSGNETTVASSLSNHFTVASGDVVTLQMPGAPAWVASINLYLTPANGAAGSEVFYENIAVGAYAPGAAVPLVSAVVPTNHAPPSTNAAASPSRVPQTVCYEAAIEGMSPNGLAVPKAASLQHDQMYHPSAHDLFTCYFVACQQGHPQYPGSGASLLNYFSLYGAVNYPGIDEWWLSCGFQQSPGLGGSNYYATQQGGANYDGHAHHLQNQAVPMRALMDWAALTSPIPPPVVTINPGSRRWFPGLRKPIMRLGR